MSDLNASQQRYVMAVFAEVSKHLDSIAALVEGKLAAQRGYPGDLSSEQRRELRTLLGAMRRELTHIINNWILHCRKQAYRRNGKRIRISSSRTWNSWNSRLPSCAVMVRWTKLPTPGCNSR